MQALACYGKAHSNTRVSPRPCPHCRLTFCSLPWARPRGQQQLGLVYNDGLPSTGAWAWALSTRPPCEA
eukprot:8174024-Pyramimonas_sp.AAC.1